MTDASEGLAPVEAAGWPVLLGVWGIYFSFGVIIASMAPLVAEIRTDIDANNAVIGAILGSWPLAYILCAIPCGMLLDQVGGKADSGPCLDHHGRLGAVALSGRDVLSDVSCGCGIRCGRADDLGRGTSRHRQTLQGQGTRHRHGAICTCIAQVISQFSRQFLTKHI